MITTCQLPADYLASHLSHLRGYHALLLTYDNWETCFSGMNVPRRTQWSKKVRAPQHMTVPMARGHGLKKGLLMCMGQILPYLFKVVLMLLWWETWKW